MKVRLKLAQQNLFHSGFCVWLFCGMKAEVLGDWQKNQQGIRQLPDSLLISIRFVLMRAVEVK